MHCSPELYGQRGHVTHRADDAREEEDDDEGHQIVARLGAVPGSDVTARRARALREPLHATQPCFIGFMGFYRVYMVL